MPDYFLCSDRQIIRRYGVLDPRHFATDHKLVLGTLISNTLKENKCYLHGRTKFPRRIPKMGPSSRLNSLWDNIEETALPPVSILEQRRKSWISEALWWIINQKNSLLRLPGQLNQTASCYLNCSLKSSLKEDRKLRAATAGALAEAELNLGRIKEAWNVIRHWFIQWRASLFHHLEKTLRRLPMIVSNYIQSPYHLIGFQY